MVMNGYDLAKYQNNHIPPNPDFILAKVTQGVHELDPDYVYYKTTCRNAGILFGAYHYAMGSAANVEVGWFTSQADHIAGENVMLDAESNPGVFSLNDPVSWCKQWLDGVNIALGIRPYIYLSLAKVREFNWARVSRDYQLWLADYLPTGPNVPPPLVFWPAGMAAWQWGGNGVDTDIYYGDKTKWLTDGGEDMAFTADELVSAFMTYQVPLVGGSKVSVQTAIGALVSYVQATDQNTQNEVSLESQILAEQKIQDAKS